jgi:hypothetical protein
MNIKKCNTSFCEYYGTPVKETYRLYIENIKQYLRHPLSEHLQKALNEFEKNKNSKLLFEQEMADSLYEMDIKNINENYSRYKKETENLTEEDFYLQHKLVVCGKTKKIIPYNSDYYIVSLKENDFRTDDSCSDIVLSKEGLESFISEAIVLLNQK